MKTVCRISRLSVLLLMLVILGCAAPPVQKERYFWPPPPDTPRIEWLGTYQNIHDLKDQSFLLAIIGDETDINLERPMYIAANGTGRVYISDYLKKDVVVFDLTAKKVTLFAEGKRDGMEIEQPTGITLDEAGNVYVADNKTRNIFVFDKNENFKHVIHLSKELASIAAIGIDKKKKHLIVPDIKGHRVLIYDLGSDSVIKVIAKETNGNPGTDDGLFNFPTGAAVDEKGNIWISDSMNARIQQFSPEGYFISKFGQRGDGVGNFSVIKTLAIDSEGHIYVTDGKANNINIFNEKGDVMLTFGGTYSVRSSLIVPGGFLLPQGIYIDQNDTIYVVDQLNRRFQVFQYVSEKYLKEHPITAERPAAKASGQSATPGKK